jgi:murein DD-endopeptidase MepM/ murein hydrolase activator NlpD
MLPVNQDRGRYRKFGKLYKEGWHVGKDFDCNLDTEVHAVADGIIIFSDMANGFGSLNPSTKGGVIIIKHENYITLYGHINRKKNKDDIVKKGETIGTIAKFFNGGFLLPHLHFAKALGQTWPDTKWGYVKTIEDLKKWIDPLR